MNQFWYIIICYSPVFIQIILKCFYLFQEPIQGTILHLLIMSLSAPLGYKIFFKLTLFLMTVLRSTVVVQLLSHVWLFATPWTAAHQACLPFTISLSLLKFISTESVKTSNHLILCHSLLLLPSIFPSIRVFSNESALRMRRPKYWSFSFSISPSNDYSRLISFRIYWFDLLTVQGTLKSLLQHHSSKASIFWHPAFFMVQLSHLYMTTGKTIVLTIQTFVSKVTSLLFNMLSLLCSSKEQTSFNFVATVTTDSDFGTQENESYHFFQFFPIYLPWSDGTRCHDLSFLNVEFYVSFFTFLFHLHQEVR